LIVASGQAAIDRAEAEEHARMAALHEATGISMAPLEIESRKAGG
jgi:hypothetical protein